MSPTTTKRTIRTLIALTIALPITACDLPNPDTGACGGADAGACPDHQYCKFDTGSCGADEAAGTCTPVPTACTEVFQPVCGCDGETYSNACFASAAGVNLNSLSPCPEPTGDLCGGIAGVQCGDGQFCRFDVGSCGDSDQSGVCTAIPDACAEIFQPVCGCDGLSYSNECIASQGSVSIAADGECR